MTDTPPAPTPPTHEHTHAIAVSVFLPDDRAHHHYHCMATYRGRGMYGVMRGAECLGADGTWSYEPMVTGRTDAWIAAHRFTRDEALLLAHAAAPHLEGPQGTAAEWFARHPQGGEE